MRKQISYFLFGSCLLFSCYEGYNPSNSALGNWENAPPLGGNARSGAACFTIADKAYVVGGINDSNVKLNDVWEYDASLNERAIKADFPGVARSGATGFSIGGKGYLGTGLGADNRPLKDFWEFDPAGASGNGTWKRVKDFGGASEIGRYGALSFVVSDRGFVGTGYDGSSELNDIWEYLSASDTWV